MSLISGEGRVEILYGATPLPIPPDREVYLGRPDFVGAHPVVVVVAGDGGVTPSVKALCRRIGRFGYVAVAVDLFRGVGSVSLASLSTSRVDGDLRDVLSVTRDEWSDWCASGRFGVLGLGTGSPAAARLASVGQGVLVAVPAAVDELAGNLMGQAVPLLTLAGGATASELQGARDAVGGEWVRYGSVAPGFFDDGSPDYERSAAEDAFRRLVAFFDAWLARVEV